MGLGKTLSMLAAIVSSLPRALQSAFSDTRAPLSQWQDAAPSKSTLVLVPSALLLESWSEEIGRHVARDTLVLHRYHGAGKTASVADLLQCDIVLTTYASIAADFCRATKQFRAIYTLPAKIRWCMTGTPIQNTLDDLGALVKFLRVPILDELPIFRRYITVPILNNTSGKFQNLRRLLEVICLRRTKTILHLPEPVTDIRALHLSREELTQYLDFGERCRYEIDLAVSGHSMKKANQHVIQAILGMRLFCNDGQAALAKRLAVTTLPSDPEEALSYLQTSSKSGCIKCDTDVTTMYQDDDPNTGKLTICQHLICGECLPTYEAELKSSEENERAQCPECGLRGERSTFIRPATVAQRQEMRIDGKYPTKLYALLGDIRAQSTDDKCIVFSFWKTTLDIVAQMLDEHGMPHCRIHGQIPAPKRSKILLDFERTSNIRILLITLGTGAVGLNKLKVANHIHILEPQWNPSVESQAIGRVLRLGQEKSVRITRYIMKNTVEEAVQSRQLRKLQLARGGFGLTKDEHSTQRVKEIMALLCPSVQNYTENAALEPSHTNLHLDLGA
ncbi:DNA repair protein rad5 [Paraphoma chrysanthemicola]|uniref:DNA repair protein rad5 n=1 Tax=Paraphoma chrysanthemicola TaxID=798071 RepID=A0A8K0W1A7_9PLEO|nr:DNA repair protein rad5 [Paraphoma chrysanthemicola]